MADGPGVVGVPYKGFLVNYRAPEEAPDGVQGSATSRVRTLGKRLSSADRTKEGGPGRKGACECAVGGPRPNLSRRSYPPRD